MILISYFMLVVLGFITQQATSQEHRSINKDYNPPIQIGDEIIITGFGHTKSVNVIRLYTNKGSCDTRPQSRRIQQDALTCNPLILKLYTRKHRVKFCKKGMGGDNRDVLIQSVHFPGLRARKPYRITITVTDPGFDVQLNDDAPIPFVTQGKVGKVNRIRATSGQFTSIVLNRGAKLPLNEPQCGLRGASVFQNRELLRVTNGQDAKPGEFPWQAAIRKKRVYTWHPYAHVCGASLISNCWVITAAHCVQLVKSFPDNYVVRVGDLHNGENDERYELDEDQQDLEIYAVYEHADYRVQAETPSNDIALIRLREVDEGQCVSYSKHVNPICLPELDKDFFPTYSKCQISGWGAKNWTDLPRQYPHVLQYGEVELKDYKQCKRMYGRVGNISQIREGMLCAGGQGVDTCQGDSGGPLVCQRNTTSPNSNNTFVLWGITSWGKDCANTDTPGVYAEVLRFIRWIKNVRAGAL